MDKSGVALNLSEALVMVCVERRSLELEGARAPGPRRCEAGAASLFVELPMKRRTGAAKQLAKPIASPRERHARGRTRADATFPIAPPRAEVPADYVTTLADIKQRVSNQRLRVVTAANSALVELYWDIGRTILDRQLNVGWGAKIIDRLSADLRAAYPDMQGFSPRNLKYMRAFAAAWPDPSIVQAPLAQLTWYHNIALLERLDAADTRLWYARSAVLHGWSRNVLVLQIENHAHERQGKAVSTFARTLPPADSDMAEQIFKDPYLFDCLGTADPRREREVEQALVDQIQRFLLELGTGFAFVGRRVHLEVGDQDFYLDLLFYHLKLRCFVVIELKSVPFDPGATLQEVAELQSSRAWDKGLELVCRQAPGLPQLVVGGVDAPGGVHQVPGVIDHRVALGRQPPIEEHQPAAREAELFVADVAVQERRPMLVERGG